MPQRPEDSSVSGFSFSRAATIRILTGQPIKKLSKLLFEKKQLMPALVQLLASQGKASHPSV